MIAITSDNRISVPLTQQRLPLALAAIGAIALVVGLATSPTRTWLNLLVDGFFVLSLGVSAIFFIASQRLASARWPAPIRRIPEAFMLILPAAAVLLIILAFGFKTLYEWTEPARLHEPHAVVPHPGRETYLSPVFVYVRMIGVVALWIFFALRFRKISLATDASREAGLAAHRPLNRYSGAFIVLFALSFTLASYDWLISLEPRWFSTMFSVYAFAGCNVQGLAAIALAVVTLKRKKLFGSDDKLVNGDLIQTLGTMVLAFSTFWAYIWVCQYLLIWYGDIPEEATWYLKRSSEGWLPVLLGSFVISWIIPFFALLPRSSKRNLKMMTAMCVLVLIGRWVDLYIIVMPSQETSPRFGLLELAMAAGTGGLVYLLFIRGLARAPIVPTHEPVLASRRSQLEGGHS
jgi:hypothetical protein